MPPHSSKPPRAASSRSGPPRSGSRAPARDTRKGPQRIAPGDRPRVFYGVLEIGPKGVFVKPASRNQKFVVELTRKNLNGAEDGDLVFVGRLEEKPEPHKPARLGDYAVRERLGSAQDVRNYSLLSLLEAGLQPNFPPKVIDSCYDFTVPELGKREDLRALPLVTIDGEDARDFDDAVYAKPDENGGWYAIIAIADVAHYVREGTVLDKEALRRGNSTYFPDRVVPMLPERLSNDLCSLRPHEDRACMHVHVWIDEEGQIKDWKIGRGLMRSAARLTYNQVQKALDGQPDQDTQPLLEQIQYLYKAFRVLLKAREIRGALDINSPERKIILDGEGGVAAVVPRERLEAHQLIEELMITANVVVAMALQSKAAPCMYRVHDRPSAIKVAMLAEYVKPLGLKLPTQQSEIQQQTFNSVLEKVQEMPDLAPVINDLVLRCQMQAVYAPDNIGHFGLALDHYAHFTSPIRRYADLINHRSLIAAFGLGDDGLQPEDHNLMEEWAQQISQTERTSMLAERACVDRFTAHFLQTQIGKDITGRIASVTSFGLFISLLDGVGEALVPMRLLPQDFYDFIEEQQVLVGQRSGRVFRLGGRVSLVITGIDPVLGSITAQLLGDESADLEGFEKPSSPARPPYRRDDRGGGDRDSRPPRRDYNDRDRKPRFDRDSRPPRRDDEDRPRRSDRDDRPPRQDRPDRDDRPPRRDDGPRPPYRGGRDAKPAYRPRGEDDSRPPRGERDDDNRAPRSYRSRDDGASAPRSPRPDYRPARDDRPPSRFRRDEGGGDSRPPRGDRDAPRSSYSPRGDRDDRPRRPASDGPRTYRPRQDDSGDNRPPRRDRDSESRSSYAPRGDRDDRPRRPSGDAPKSYRSDAPRGDRPQGKPAGKPSGGKPAGKASYGRNPPKKGGNFRK